MGMYRDLSDWISNVTYNDFLQDITNRVKGQDEGVRTLCACIYQYANSIVEGKPHKVDILLAAPSGCGKTEFYRAIRDYFKKQHINNFVVTLSDVSSVTETGYRGMSAANVLTDFIKQDCRFGLCFLDELDKKLVPSYNAQNENANKPVQAEFLTMVEGCDHYKYELKEGRQTRTGEIDTSSIMFIGMGAFDAFREKRKEVKHTVGFNSEDETEVQQEYAPLTRRNIVEYGGCNEFVGRFGCIVNFHPLEAEIVDEIVDGFIEDVSEQIGFKVTISEDFRTKIHDEAANTEFGCRLIKSMIFESTTLVLSDFLENGYDSSQYYAYVDVDKTELLPMYEDTKASA